MGGELHINEREVFITASTLYKVKDEKIDWNTAKMHLR